MPIAAVPSYLGNDVKEASPAMRFGLLLPVWTTRQDQEAEVNRRAQARSREGQEVQSLLEQGMDVAIRALRQRQPHPLPGLWAKNDFAARNSWAMVKALTASDRVRMTAVLTRQWAIAQTVSDSALIRLDARAIAPFTTGLGNEHPLENGFAFLNPYGLPYLPGSGVKGVLRQAARELAGGAWGDSHGWSEDRRYPLVASGKPVLDSRNQPVVLSMLDMLFGSETPAGESDHVRGALTFWDVIPRIEGDSLQVEIMTPHQSHYYQQNAAAGSTSPHESGSPNPISFLTVPPGSGFAFHVVCDLPHLQRLAPELAEGERWKSLLQAAFSHAFAWLGFGAKTSVGYGAMHEDREATARAEAAAEARRREWVRAEELARMTPNQQTILAFCDFARQRFEQLRGGRERQNADFHTRAKHLAESALGADWAPAEKRAAAEAVETWLPRIVERFDRKDDWKQARRKFRLAELYGDAN